MVNYRKILLFIISFSMIGFAAPSFCDDLGIVGQVYAIKEEDFLEFIKSHLAEMQQSGELQRRIQQFQSNVSNHTDRPVPVVGITRASTTRTWEYDPSITTPYDLKDYNGNTFVKAGTKVNPLNYVSLSKTLIFYNADDSDQVNWVKDQVIKLHDSVKLILVNGSISSQEKIFHKPIYFDQLGKLVEKFNITHVPAEVSQENLYLKITEAAL